MILQYPYAAGETTIRVLEAGPQDGRTALLLHGVGARADRWRLALTWLAEAGVHAFAIDFPGHGFASKGTVFDYSVPSYAALCRAFLRSVGATRSVVVGTSLGGYVAAALAVSDPELVAGMMLVGALGITPIGSAGREALAASVQDITPEGIARKLRRVVHDERLVTPAWEREEVMINNSPGAAEAFEKIGAYLRSELDDDVVGIELQKLVADIPTTLVWGAEDRIVTPETGRAAQALLGPATSLTLIAGAGHAPYLESPDAFHRVVDEFLGLVGTTESTRTETTYA